MGSLGGSRETDEKAAIIQSKDDGGWKRDREREVGRGETDQILDIFRR